MKVVSLDNLKLFKQKQDAANDAKFANLASPAFTGAPTAPTAENTTNNTQLATTAFVHSLVDAGLASVANGLVFKGTVGSVEDAATVTALPVDPKIGDTYKVVTAAVYDGQVCEVGDMLICYAAANLDTSAPAQWAVVQGNIDGAMTGPASAVDGQVPVFDGATGKVLKGSGFTLGASVPSDAKFTDTDTKNTVGATAAEGKIFLVGTSAQEAEAQSYSNEQAYVDAEGNLYSGGSKVLTSADAAEAYTETEINSIFEPAAPVEGE